MTIDFTNCTQLVNTYEGADFKRKVIYDGSVYMLKFGQKLESDEKKPLQASYSSAPVSEYLGSHTVSYTHLDVYKRQSPTIRTPRIRPVRTISRTPEVKSISPVAGSSPTRTPSRTTFM